jgi:cytochrome c556
MKPSAMTIGAILLGAAILSASPSLAQAQATKQEHKLTLRAIMQELGAEYLRLTSALLVGDFKGLEESAKAIQTHPLPDEIVVAIKNKLGRNFRAFERADEQSHRGAADLVKRAAAKDIAGSAKAFGGIADGCVSCHKQFRAPLRSLSD